MNLDFFLANNDLISFQFYTKEARLMLFLEDSILSFAKSTKSVSEDGFLILLGWMISKTFFY